MTIIYAVRNTFKDHVCYVGQTSVSIKKMWGKLGYSGTLEDIVKKEHQIYQIDYAKTQEEADKKERIRHINNIPNGNGAYNRTMKKRTYKYMEFES